MTSYSVYFLIDSFVQNSEQVVTNFLLDDTERLLAADQFYQKYGDYYVSGFISGGSFVALLEMQTSSREVKDEISTDLDATYGAATFSVGGKFSIDVKNASKHRGVQLQSYLQEVGVSGVTDDLKDGGTVEGLIEAANKFPERVKDGGNPLYAILTPYSSLKNSPKACNSINIGVTETLRQDIDAVYLRAKTILESVIYAQNNPTQFAEDQDKFNQIKSNTEQILAKVTEANNALNSGQDLSLVQKLIPEIPDSKLIPARLWGGTKANIAPPEHVIPSTIRYQVADAYKYLENLTDEKLRQDVEAYLAQVTNDLTENFVNSYDLIVKLSAYISALIASKLPSKSRSKLVEILQDDVVKHRDIWSDAIESQKAMFVKIDTNERERNNQLQVIKNLNAEIWKAGETRYGGGAYWESMAGIIDSLKTNVSHWDSDTAGEEYISFKAGEWKYLKEKFHDALKNFRQSPV